MQSIFGYTREEMGPVNLWSARIIATFGALLCCGVCTVFIASAFTNCGGLNLPLPHNVEIAIGLRYWPPMLLFIAGALAFAVYYLPKIEVSRQVLFVVLVAAWAFAGSEAAAFHTGPIANTWGVLAFAIWITLAIGTWRWRASR